MTTPTIGSSEVAAILGVSRWGSPFKLWAQLTGLAPRYDGQGNAATERGKMMEEALGNRYAREKGCAIVRGPSLEEAPLIHPAYPWMAARPDFFARFGEDEGPGRVLECKTSRSLDESEGWGPAGTDEVPQYYAIQICWQLIVTGAQAKAHAADLAAFGMMNDDFRIYHFERRPKLEDAIINRVSEWYDRHVVKGEMPEVDSTEDCSRFLAKVFPGRPEKLFVQATSDDVALAAKAAALKANIAEQQSQLDAIYNEIRLKIGDNYGLKDGKTTIATWGLRKGAARFATARFKKDFPDLAKTYEEIGEDGRTFKFTYAGDEE